MAKLDPNKFSFAQMTSNANGKTSASGSMGIFIILIGGVTFLCGSLGMIFKATDSNILIQSIALVYAGALLLGYRKSKDADAKQESPDQPANAAPEAPSTETDSAV